MGMGCTPTTRLQIVGSALSLSRVSVVVVRLVRIGDLAQVLGRLCFQNKKGENREKSLVRFFDRTRDRFSYLVTDQWLRDEETTGGHMGVGFWTATPQRRAGH